MEKKQTLSISKLFWYFVLFSILGLVIETVFGYVTTGVIESRKGLLWGPFCPVYGVGAVLLIFFLDKVEQKNYFKLFAYGFLIGSIAEYMLSYGLEAIYGSRFWDYTYTGKDINGRICTLYSLFWGILAIILMKFIKPNIDKLIEKIPTKINKNIQILLFIFLVIDTIVTIWAVSTYETRATNKHYNKTSIVQENTNWFTSIKNKIEEEYFTNKRMKETFPNLRITDENGNQIWISTILTQNE